MLPDHGGTGWSLASDAVAGRPVVLVFLRGTAKAPARAQLLGFRDRYGAFAAEGALVAAVTRQPIGINATDREELGLPFRLLADLVGDISRGYAAMAGCRGEPEVLTCVLTPALKIARFLVGPATRDHAAAALAEVRRLTVPRVAAEAVMHPPILQIPGVLSPEECRFLIALHDRPGTPWNEPDDPDDQYDFKIRVGDHRRADRVDYVINDPEIQAFLDRALNRRIAPEILRAFQYKVTRREAYHLACYQGLRGGFSIGHRDNSTPALAHRRFALSLSLNHEEYQGGELVFREYGEQRYRLPTGAALIFSSSLLHEILTVTSGRRFVLLSHLYGDDRERPRGASQPAEGGPRRREAPDRP